MPIKSVILSPALMFLKFLAESFVKPIYSNFTAPVNTTICEKYWKVLEMKNIKSEPV